MDEFMKLLGEYMENINKANQSGRTGTLKDLTIDPISPSWDGFFGFLCSKAVLGPIKINKM